MPLSRTNSAIEPDLTALGKIIGGGLPIGAYGGRKEIMEQVAPLGPAYQAGTMAGNPASISAGIACLEVLQAARRIRPDGGACHSRSPTACSNPLTQHGIPLTINRIRGAFSTHFCDHPVTNYEEAQDTDGEQFARFFRLMLDQGICLAPSKYEAWFLTTAHTEQISRRRLQQRTMPSKLWQLTNNKKKRLTPSFGGEAKLLPLEI